MLLLYRELEKGWPVLPIPGLVPFTDHDQGADLNLREEEGEVLNFLLQTRVEKMGTNQFKALFYIFILACSVATRPLKNLVTDLLPKKRKVPKNRSHMKILHIDLIFRL